MLLKVITKKRVLFEVIFNIMVNQLFLDKIPLMTFNSMQDNVALYSNHLPILWLRTRNKWMNEKNTDDHRITKVPNNILDILA